LKPRCSYVPGKWSEKSFVARPLGPEEIRAVKATIDEAAKEYRKN